MPMTQSPGTSVEQPFAAYIHGLLEHSARTRLPHLFANPRGDALFHSPNRHGVSVIAVHTSSLREEQLTSLLAYRLAQYLLVNFVDARTVYQARITHEPLAEVAPDDIHIVAGSAETGQILCYASIRAAAPAAPRVTLRTRERPLFPVEKAYGWGTYNRLPILPDLPITRVRELGRFVKNQHLPALDPLVIRAPVEVGVAMFRLLGGGPLTLPVTACIGELEEDIAKHNLDFFHIPTVVLHGVLPYAAEDSFFVPLYDGHNRYPFALLLSDLVTATPRLAAIEAALDQPGRQGLLALLQLKRDTQVAPSSLEPPEGLAALTDVVMQQRDLSMQTRRRMLDAGDWLRSTDLFGQLSIAEAAMLGRFMERCTAQAGDVIIQQGELGDAFYLIESGSAVAQMAGPSGQRVTVEQLGPGSYFGEIALVTGGDRTADVVAVTPMTLLRMTGDAYVRYLSHAVEVEQQIMRTALRRMDTLRSQRRERNYSPGQKEVRFQ